MDQSFVPLVPCAFFVAHALTPKRLTDDLWPYNLCQHFGTRLSLSWGDTAILIA